MNSTTQTGAARSLAYGNGMHPVQPGALPLYEIDLLPNLPYTETLLRVVDYAAAEIDLNDPCRYRNPDRLTSLLIDLCLARYHRDLVGQAAMALGFVPGETYQGDVYTSLWNTFIELFPGLEVEEAKRVAQAIAYGGSGAEDC